MANSLGVNISYDEKSQAKIEKAKNDLEINHTDLPIIETSFFFQKERGLFF